MSYSSNGMTVYSSYEWIGFKSPQRQFDVAVDWSLKDSPFKEQFDWGGLPIYD